MKNLDQFAIALFGLVAELEELKPGIAATNGWVNIQELQAFETALTSASKATPPDGLR